MNRRRKLLLFGAVNKARQLADAFFASVIADGGEIENEQVFVDFFQLILDHNALSFMQEHSKVLFPEARRKTTGTDNVNKWYNLFSKYGHATQTSASLQPFVVDDDRNGKAVLNYNFDRGFIMPNGTSFSKDVPFISSKVVSMRGTEGFSVYLSDRNDGGGRFQIGHNNSATNVRVGYRRVDTDSFSSVNADIPDEWQLLDGFSDYQNTTSRFFRNKNEIASSTTIGTQGNTGNTNATPEIGLVFPSLPGAGFLNTKMAAIIRFNDPPPAALSEAIDDFLMDYYDLPA